MAEEKTKLEQFFDNQASASLWDVAVSLKRGNALPLDANSVFQSMDKLNEYRNGGGPAYPGQIVAIVEETGTQICYLDKDLNVCPVGVIPSGVGAISVSDSGAISINVDNKSIESINNKISMHDYGVAYYEYIPEVKDESGNVTKEASYSKVTVSESKPWKAGLEPKVVTEDGQLVIGWFEPNPTTIEGVNDQVTAVQGTVADLEQSVGTPSAEGKEATGLYKEVEDVQGEVEELADSVGNSGDALGADVNTLWANVNDHKTRIKALEDKEDKDTTYTAKSDDKVLSLNGTEFSTELGLKHENGKISLTGKAGAVIAEFSDSDFIQDGFLSSVELVEENPNLEGDKTVGGPFLKFVWNTDSMLSPNTTYVAIGELVDVYTAGNGLELNSNEFAIKLDATNEAFLSVGENGLKLAGVQEAINTAKQAAIEAAAADATSKANTAKQEAINEAATDATTKAGNAKNEAIADAATKYYSKGDLYTKSEVDELLDGIQGGASESAASVKTQLDAYKKVVNAEVWGDEAGTGTDGNSRIDILDQKVKALEDVGSQANVIESVVGAADNRLSVSTTGKVVTIDDTNLRTDIGNAKKAGDDAAAAAETNAQAITGHDRRIGALETAKGEHDTAIKNLQDADVTANGKIQSIETAINNETSGLAATHAKAVQNATDIATLNAKDKTHDEDIAGLKTSTGNNATAITNLQTAVGNVYTKTEADGKYATKAEVGTPTQGKTIVQMIAEAQQAATYDDTPVKTLIGDDANKSVRAIASEEVAKVVDGAPEAMNTLKEVAQWIEDDQTGAAAMAAGIAENKAEIARVEAKIPGVDDKTIKLSENKAYVAEVSTDVLVQGTQELVLCGGDASGFASTT